MKFTISQSTLATHLAQVVGILPIRPTHPALGNILLDAKNNLLSLTAFDLSVSITSSIALAVEKEGTITVPGKMIASLVDSLPHKELRIQLTDELLEIGCIEANYQIQGISAEEFPQLPTLAIGNNCSVEAKSLLAALIPVVSSYATDPSKQVLTGVRFTLSENSLELASTDAHRLALTRLSLKSEQTGAFTVPGSSLAHLAKLLKTLSAKEKVTIIWDKVQIKFVLPNTELICRLLEGAYPAYQQLIPSDFTVSINFLISQMQTAVNRLLILHSQKQKSPLVKIENSSSRGQINLSLLDGFGGSGIEVIPAQVPEDITIAFNGQYLLEALKALPGKELQFHANHPNRPAILQAIETELTCALILLMPCQLTKEIEQPVNTPPLPSKLQEEGESNQKNSRTHLKAVTNS